MSDPSEILKRRLRDVIDHHHSSEGLHFFAQIGGPTDAFGMTTLQVSGTGSIILGWRQDDERLLYSYVFSESDRARFYKMLLELPFWESATTRRSGKDGEMNIHMRLSDQKAGTWNGIQCWHTDLAQYTTVEHLCMRLRRLMESISDEQMPIPQWLDALA